MEKQSQKQAVKFALRQMSVTLVKLNTLKGTGIDLTEFTDPPRTKEKPKDKQIDNSK